MSKIKDRITGEIMFEGRGKTIRELVECKIKQNANLSYANLSNANLSYANLSNANLSYSDLKGSNLRDANLRGSDLSNADLSYSNLRNANLRDSYLGKADLSYSDLKGSNLRGANLSYSDLKGSNLRGANLRSANLKGSDLHNSTLSNADLRVNPPPVESHQFISEILYRQAETGPQLDFAARIRIQSGCKYNWEFFINLARKKRVLKWACKILFQWDEFKERFEKEGK